MSRPRPVSSLSLDLDNKWSYLKTHGDTSWESYPSYLDEVVPVALQSLDALGLTITVFVVGRDASIQANQEAIASIAAAGHEIGNHSFQHDPWLHLYTEQQIDDDLARAEEHIERVTGQRPIGFRGPGFSLSEATLRVLVRRGYRYDGSTLPTFIGPLGRAYFLMGSKLSKEEREQRKALYGDIWDALRPNKPYRWQLPEGDILELPVTTVPILKAPFHVSYILYLSTFSHKLAMTYLRASLEMCLATGVEPSVLLHPLDFIGGDRIKDLDFFPAMRMPTGRKLELVEEILTLLKERFQVRTMQQHVRAIESAGRLRMLAPEFST